MDKVVLRNLSLWLVWTGEEPSVSIGGMKLTHAFVIPFALWLLPASGFAETKIDCFKSSQPNVPQKHKLWDGYEISLGPTAHSSDEPEKACTDIWPTANRAGMKADFANNIKANFPEFAARLQK